MPVFLGGKPGTERVVLFTSQNGISSKAELQRFNEEKKAWLTEYIKIIRGVPRLELLSGYWELMKKYVVILYYKLGRDRFLDYYVIGESEGIVCELAERIQIYMGDVWFEGGKLIEAEGNRYRVWTRKNSRFVLAPYELCIIPNSYVIEYAISEDEKVRLANKDFDVKAGDIVQVIRIDSNPVLEKIIFYFTPGIKYIPHKSAFKILNKGKFKFTIIPGGYNWRNAVIVTVNAG